jgi:hypothetical protein
MGAETIDIDEEREVSVSGDDEGVNLEVVTSSGKMDVWTSPEQAEKIAHALITRAAEVRAAKKG